MPKINYKYFSLSEDQMQDMLSSCKDLIIENLFDEGKISSDTFKEWVVDRTICTKKPSFFSSIYRKFLSKEKNTEILVIVKNITMTTPKDIIDKLEEKIKTRETKDA